MKKAIACAAVLFALMGITEFHRVNYINDCHSRGGYTETKLFFFNQCWADYDSEDLPVFNRETNEWVQPPMIHERLK